MRVYLQVQEWKGSADGLIPTEWGWQLCDEGFVPLQTALAPAPDNLLPVIRCSCLTDCSSLRCTCKKHNIECGNCRGSGCTNSLQMACDDDRDDECKSLDCLNVLPRFTRTVSATFSYFMMTLIMICRIVSCFTRTLCCFRAFFFNDFTI